MKKRLNVIIGLLVSAFFVYLAFRRVEITEIVHSIRKVNYLWIIPNMVLVIFTMWIRSYRWKYLLRPVRQLRVASLFPPVMIGFMANNILPVRLGEIIRAYSLGAKTGESRSSIFATVVIERIFDSLSLLLLFWLVFISMPVPRAVKQFGIASLALNVVAVMALLLLRKKLDFLAGVIFGKLSFVPARFSERAEYALRKFSEGLSIFGEYRTLGIVSFWSVILWFLIAVSNYFVFIAFGYYPNIVASFILLLFVAAAVMLPSAPGFVGVFQAGVIGAFALMNRMDIMGSRTTWANIHELSLTVSAFCSSPVPAIGSVCEAAGLFGISKALSLSFSIVLWLSQYLPVTLIGLYYLRREHLSLKIEDK